MHVNSFTLKLKLSNAVYLNKDKAIARVNKECLEQYYCDI